ncbi:MULTISPECIES: glutamine synthetase family protein [Kordiimonas]|uniref:glutamine synthetase family protein n=1 Tax=Kordiimonas TaxID=288021 RepID=UPI00257AF8CA|nr:glutamine synthetase family protein [Kordiimonas sp. UBA4487]
MSSSSMPVGEEIKSFLKDNPDIEVVEVLIADMNGIFRGKQMPVSGLKKLAKAGVPFPITTTFLTTNGSNAEAILDDYGSDPDRICMPVPGTLKRVPWASRPTAQILVTMQDSDGAPFFMDPRSVLQRVLDRYAEKRLRPVIALEYEFFLFEAGSVPPVPVSPPNGMSAASGANCYNMDVYYDFEGLMQEIEESCRAQGLDVIGLVCEYGNGQFEVNLQHTSDVERACDDALLLKRAVKAVALKHGLLASFMAKPTYDEVGNGLHAHVSVLDADGSNIFAGEGGETKLKRAVGGLLETMPEATAFFAPNANSYRRFDPEWFAPVVPNWGENNRRLSVRLPLSDDANRRFEHRVCGADVCPHLVVAAILAGAFHGLEEKTDPGEPLGEFDLVDFDGVLPSRWLIALDVLEKGKVMPEYLGRDFVDLYLRIRRSEEEEFHRQISVADYEQYLRII